MPSRAFSIHAASVSASFRQGITMVSSTMSGMLRFRIDPKVSQSGQGITVKRSIWPRVRPLPKASTRSARTALEMPENQGN